jgi:Flp pilus assembly protein protease CpaA
MRSQASAAVVVFILTLLLALFCGLGMGDVKLVAVLALFVLPPHVASYQIFIFSVAFSAFIYALCISRGELRKLIQIPLAPSIVFGTIITLIAK